MEIKIRDKYFEIIDEEEAKKLWKDADLYELAKKLVEDCVHGWDSVLELNLERGKFDIALYNNSINMYILHVEIYRMHNWTDMEDVDLVLLKEYHEIYEKYSGEDRVDSLRDFIIKVNNGEIPEIKEKIDTIEDIWIEIIEEELHEKYLEIVDRIEEYYANAEIEEN